MRKKVVIEVYVENVEFSKKKKILNDGNQIWNYNNNNKRRMDNNSNGSNCKVDRWHKWNWNCGNSKKMMIIYTNKL